ncbi:PH domain-containing protein [Rhodococcus coprophilus]|uniref:PH domain-containing protein n=1 Tax=Rhodococcus coprophilus TaxID=38310 RepID=UPI0037AF443A
MVDSDADVGSARPEERNPLPAAVPAPQVRMADPAWRPSERARTLWAINAALLWVPVVVAQVVWTAIDPRLTVWHVAAAVATAVLAALHIIVVPQWRYRVHRWEISDTAVYTRSGWFTQERRIAPISRIQTVDTERGPIDRWLGLATVTVTTASSAGAVEITALDAAVADETVARLTEIAGRDGVDAT